MDLEFESKETPFLSAFANPMSESAGSISVSEQGQASPVPLVDPVPVPVNSQETYMVQGVDLKPLLDEYFTAQQEMAESEKAHRLVVERFLNLRLPILNVLKNNVESHSLEFGDRTFVLETQDQPESSRPSYETVLHALEEFIGKYTQLPPDQVPQFALQCANFIWDQIPRKTKETMRVNKKRKMEEDQKDSFKRKTSKQKASKRQKRG